MPPSTIMHGGTLPLNSFSFRPKSKSRTSPPHEFTWELMLDSTRLLSGLLKSYGNVVEYAIATSGSKTVISRPSRSTNVAVIEWKEGWVETEELRINQSEWMDVSKWTSSQAHVFKKWGKNPEILWEVKGGEWEATNTKKQVLAAFVVRRGALGTRIELTDLGRPFADALVLTGILTVTGEEEWRWHTFLQARRDQIEGRSAAVPEPEPGTRADGPSAQLPEETPPTYREAPFTRPLGPLLGLSSVSTDTENGLSLPTDRPLKLTLASRHPLNGTWYEDDQPVVYVRTTGPRTTINQIVHTTLDAEPLLKVIGMIDWAGGKSTVCGIDVELGNMFNRTKGPVFSKASRKSQVCSLPTLTSHWTTTPHTSSASIYPDPNAHIRYECRSAPPDNHPLALLTHYLRRKGTTMELTPEGHGVLSEVFIGSLALIYGTTGEWKKVTGVGTTVGGEGMELVLGEEMVSDLDGWAGPVELMRLRQQED